MRQRCMMCGAVFVCTWARRNCFGCTPHPKITDPNLVLAEYAGGLTYVGVGLKLGVDTKVVESYVRTYGSPRASTEKSGRHFPEVRLDPSWVDGWLLGDGGLELQGGEKANARARHNSSKLEYTEYVKDSLTEMGIKFSPKIWKEATSETTSIFCVTSHCHPDLTLVFRRWYPDGEKRIPTDLVLNPSVLREWFLGDGAFSARSPSFIMGNVLESEVDFMLALLNQLFDGAFTKLFRPPSSKPTKSGRQRLPTWQLYCAASLRNRFYDYIGPCPLSVYRYRWPMVETENV